MKNGARYEKFTVMMDYQKHNGSRVPYIATVRVCKDITSKFNVHVSVINPRGWTDID
jgi:hypothetical protein